MKPQAGSVVDDHRALLRRLGVEIDDALLLQALTHRSYAHEAGGELDNERLEFLGDSVLGIIVTEYLYQRHPDVGESDLSKMRAATVSERALAQIARTLDLGDHVRLGRGEVVTGGGDKDSILADTMEALIGATYLQHGLEPTRAMVEQLALPLLRSAKRLSASLDWKTSLQEIAALHGLPLPAFEVESTGPDHNRTFTATARVGTFTGSGVGSSKKSAEHAAAEQAYDAISAAFATDAV